ncbi:MAG: three-Cys-motif partner protein TcmP [Candidatus Eisenbacteria bacterium]
MGTEGFFEESLEQSRVKSAIVAKYFSAWARVMIPWARRDAKRVAYIDLFAGPGRYDDGTKSTPIMVLETALANPDLTKMLVSVFNDKDEDHCQSLESAIKAVPGIERLKHPPQVHNEEVGEQIVKMFEKSTLVPTLFFVDPWGYKGLSLRLVNSVLKDWGCDCIFFFNYTRINMGLGNAYVKEHIDALFGEERGATLRARLELLPPDLRETTIIEELATALREMGGTYVLPFRFRSESGRRTKHHLIFVSKHVRGYEIMKGIMASESSKTEQGVPSFEYSPADRNYPLLFELARPLDELESMLEEHYAGQTMAMSQVYEGHHVGRRFIKRNYKDALRKMEESGAVKMDPPADRRRKRNDMVTVADSVSITFRRRKK